VSIMNELQTKYKALIIGISLVALLPLAFAATNKQRFTSFTESTYIIQAVAKHYEIDMHECIKCQKNGWKFGSILVIFLVLVILFSFVISLIPIAIVMKLFAGWSLDFTIQILLLGSYPDTWKVTST